MEGLRDELLSGPALARDEDRRARGRGLAHGLEDALHGCRAAHELAEAAGRVELRAQGAVLGDEAPLLERLLDDVDDLLVAERLRDVVEGALAHRRDRALDGGVRRDDDDGNLRVPGAHLDEDLEARAVREHEVEEEEVDGLLLEALQPLGGRRGLARDVARLREDRTEHLADDGFVVEDEDGCHGQVATGSVTVNRAPGEPEAAVSVPP